MYIYIYIHINTSHHCNGRSNMQYEKISLLWLQFQSTAVHWMLQELNRRVFHIWLWSWSVSKRQRSLLCLDGFFASICAEAASVGKNNSMVIALQLGWRLEVVTVGHPVKKVLGVTVRHLPTSVTPNVNPWLINPGSLTVMVPPNNSTWLLTW